MIVIFWIIFRDKFSVEQNKFCRTSDSYPNKRILKKVYIGSENPVKIESARRGFEQVFKEITCEILVLVRMVTTTAKKAVMREAVLVLLMIQTCLYVASLAKFVKLEFV